MNHNQNLRFKCGTYGAEWWGATTYQRPQGVEAHKPGCPVAPLETPDPEPAVRSHVQYPVTWDLDEALRSTTGEFWALDVNE